MAPDGITLFPGDILRIERRLLVEGVVTALTNEGTFAGVEVVGSAEHIVLHDESNGVRMFPLHAVAEITLVKAVARAAKPQAPAWDPGVA